MIGFFYLDVCFCILSYFIYNILLKDVADIFSAFIATAFILFLMYFAFLGLIAISNELKFGNYSNNPAALFYPYYDVSLYIICLCSAHVLNVRKYLSYNKEVAKPAFAIYTGLNLFLVPGLLILTVIFNQCHLPMKISLALALLIARHYTEYRRYKGFIEIESEIKDRFRAA